MLSLLAITVGVRVEPFLVTMSMLFLRVGPCFIEGVLGMGWVVAAVGAGFDSTVGTLCLGFQTTYADTGAGWVVVDLGGGHRGLGEDPTVDLGVSSHGGPGMGETAAP
jgi:hypothetical protein